MCPPDGAGVSGLNILDRRIEAGVLGGRPSRSPGPSDEVRVKRDLEIIVKVTEVCNINCSYCYFFNGPDQSFRFHPKRIAANESRGLSDYVARAVADGLIKSVRFIIHGGEPLMMGKRAFADFCRSLDLGALPIPLNMSMQTNAMLLDNEWIRILADFNFDVGVSIDGPAAYHDQHRVDHRGRGTHARTVAGIELLKQAVADRTIRSLGALCVVDPSRDGRIIYRHIVHELGLRRLAFILPDGDWSTVDAETVEAIGGYLGVVLHEWLSDDDPGIQVRSFGSMLAFALSRDAAKDSRGDAVIIGVSSDGTVGPDDAFRTTMPDLFRPENAALNLRTSTLADFLSLYEEGHFRGLKAPLRPKCLRCQWVSHCRGGDAPHRYDHAHGVWRESVYCEALKRIYSQLHAWMLEHGVPRRQLDAAFPPMVQA